MSSKVIEIKRDRGSSLFRVTELEATSELALRSPDLRKGNVVIDIDGQPMHLFSDNDYMAEYIRTNEIKYINSVSYDTHRRNTTKKNRESKLVANSPIKKVQRVREQDNKRKQLKRQQEKAIKVEKHIIPFTELGLDIPTGPTSEHLNNYTKAEDDREIILAYHAQFPFGYHITTVSPKIFMDFCDSKTDSY